MIRNLPVALLLSFAAACRSVPEPEPEPVAGWLRDSVLASVEDNFDDPAQLVPASARVYLRVGPAGAIFGNERDPLVAEAWKLIEETIPEHVWSRAAEKVGLDWKSFVGGLFGQDLTLVELRHRGQRRAVALARPAPERLRDLPDLLGLILWDVQDRIGPWNLYRGETGKKSYLLALGTKWLAIADIESCDHLRRILTARAAEEPTLAEDGRYQEILGRLPASTDALLYTRSGNGEDRHAISLSYHGDALEAHYAARARRVEKYVDPLEAIPTAEFGPLPDDVVVAGTVSMLTREIPGESFLDLVLFPGDFRGSVLPGIRPPLVFFLGKVNRDRFSPDPGFTVPVAGLALRLRDPSAAAALDHLCSRIHFFLSISRLDLIEGLFGSESVERGDLHYHVADFGSLIFSGGRGPIIEKLATLPQAQLLTRVAYGRVGDYYVVCNQEEFLRTWNDSMTGSAARLDGAADFQDFELGDRQGLVASVVTRGRQLAMLLDELTGFIRNALGDEDARALEEQREEEQIEKKEAEKLEEPLRWLARGFQNRRAVSVQVWRGEEGMLLGRLVALP